MSAALPIAALLALGAPLGAGHSTEKLPVLIISGANNHWFEWTTPSLEEILEESGRFAVDVTHDPASTLADAEAISKYQAFVLDYNGPRWGAEAEKGFLEAVRGGTGVTVVHAANNAFEGWREYEELVALCWREGTGHGRFHAFDVRITDREHPITKGLTPLVAHNDELYHDLVPMHGVQAGVDYEVLAVAHSSLESGGTGDDEPMMTVRTFGEGRIFHTPLGHVWGKNESNQISHFDPGFRELIARGTEWAATGAVTVNTRPLNSLTLGERRTGWQLLFDGETTDGLRGFKKEGFPEEGWAIENGALHKIAGAGGGDLVTERAFRDFEFAFEWKVAAGANSGIMYRVTEDHGAPWETGLEYQILDDDLHADGQKASTSAGALYALYPAEDKLLQPVGEWNSGRILVVGNHVEHWLNGRLVAQTELESKDWNERLALSKFESMPDFGKRPAGLIALQDHGDDVWFRNLKIRDLAPAAEPDDALFSGKNLEGWGAFLQKGAKRDDVWRAEAGVLVCKGSPAGYVMTKQKFANYVLRLDWRFPPESGGGNSGVLLRKIGEDKVWPRSIEAQLQSGNAGDFWNIGEYPMLTEKTRLNGRNTKHVRSNENALGEWNHYDITVFQGHVVLRVNGEILNQAAGCMEIAGQIALQSEGAEIHFKDITLARLP